MSNTPPPLRKSQSEPDGPKSKSTLSKLADGIKQRVSEVQTRPDFSKFKLGEIQTKPDWMTRKSKPPATQDGMIEWVRIIPFAGQKNVADKLPSKLGGLGGEIRFRFLKDKNSQLHIYAGYRSVDDLRRALDQRLPNTDLQDSAAPPIFAERLVHRVGELGGVLNEKGRLEAVLDALEAETYLEIVFEQRPDHEFKTALRDCGKSSGKGKSSSTLGDAADAWKEILGFGAKPVTKKTGGQPAKRELSVEEKDQAKRIADLMTESTNYFRVTIKIGSQQQNHTQTIFNELNSQLKNRHRFRLADEDRHARGKKNSPEALWREEELAVLVALPDMTTDQMLRSVTHMKPGERTLGDDELTTGVAIGRLIHPTKADRLVKIPTEQFLKHGFLSGKTGAGKTSTAAQAIQSLLDDWVTDPGRYPGFSYIDPNGSALTVIMNRLLYMEQQGAIIPWEKVHFLDMRPESKYPVGLNLLHCSEDDDITEVSQNIVDMIMSTYGSSGTLGKTEKLMDNGLATLLTDRSRVHTVFGINYIYMYPAFRESLTFRHPMLKLFWRTEGADVSSSDLTAMNNRLRPLLNATSMRRIFGQTGWSLKIRQWMDDGHIVLINALNLSEVGMKMAMGQLVTQYHATAKQRPQDISKPHVLMIDEAHLAQIPILEKVIAEDRKFGLSLVLITQFPEQFNGKLLDAITENMGTFMTCTLGPKSAGAMSSMMNNAFDKPTLQGLPDNDVAVMTKIDKKPFSFKVRSDPPVIYLPNGKIANYNDKKEGGEMWRAQQWAMDKALELSARDGRPVEIVDREFDEYDEWWQQFAPEDINAMAHTGIKESEQVDLNSEKNSYVPTIEESKVLQALIEMVNEEREWSGNATDLINDLGLDSSVWSVQRLGKSLVRAKTWLIDHGFEVEYTTPRGRPHWRFWV